MNETINESPISPVHRKLVETTSPRAKLDAITARIPLSELPLDYLNATTFSDLYIVDRVLGAGTFGVVLKVFEKQSGDEYAIKIIPKGSLHDEQVDHALNEVNMMKKISHPNIVRFVKVPILIQIWFNN